MSLSSRCWFNAISIHSETLGLQTSSPKHLNRSTASTQPNKARSNPRAPSHPLTFPTPPGLSFIGFLVGCLAGELLSGKLSDVIVAHRTRRNGGVFVPEMRLTPLPAGLVLLPLGILLWGVFIQMKAPWIAPVVAGGIAICGLQIIITIGSVL